MPFFTISCDAQCIALPSPCSVREPPVGLATRLYSGSEVRRRMRSTGTPSTRETICANVVSCPWPWLWEAVRSVMLPSFSQLMSAWSWGAKPPGAVISM